MTSSPTIATKIAFLYGKSIHAKAYPANAATITVMTVAGIVMIRLLMNESARLFRLRTRS